MKLLIAMLVAAMSAGVASINPTNESSAELGHPLDRRWYGILEWDPAKEPYTRRPVPWPVTCENPKLQPVRYCFKDKRSARNLGEIVDRAIAGWSHAMVHSALRIILDPSTGGDPEVTCDDKRVPDDALVISDESKDDDDEWNQSSDCATLSQVGYLPHNYVVKGHHRGRHMLMFCSCVPSLKDTKEFGIKFMMHELGHAIGLGHEHQRPDRDQYLKVMPRRLQGYKEAVEAATKDEHVAFHDSDGESEDLETKKALITTQALYASIYFPEAMDWIRGDRYDDHANKQAFRQRTFSQQFDFNSIMIYSSDTLANDEDKPVIVRRSDGGLVHTGGNANPGKVTISAGDIARVAMLYDNGSPECRRAQDGGNWGPVRVRIRDGLEETVLPPWQR